VFFFSGVHLLAWLLVPEEEVRLHAAVLVARAHDRQADVLLLWVDGHFNAGWERPAADGDLNPGGSEN